MDTSRPTSSFTTQQNETRGKCRRHKDQMVSDTNSVSPRGKLDLSVRFVSAAKSRLTKIMASNICFIFPTSLTHCHRKLCQKYQAWTKGTSEVFFWREAGDVWCNIPSLKSQGCHLNPPFFLILSPLVFLPSSLALSVSSFILLFVHSHRKSQTLFCKS